MCIINSKTVFDLLSFGICFFKIPPFEIIAFTKFSLDLSHNNEIFSIWYFLHLRIINFSISVSYPLFSSSGNTLKSILPVNFSEEFINNHKGGKDEEEKTMETIVNTLTELTEVNEIKILINGEENRAFNDGEINFNENFIRND